MAEVGSAFVTVMPSARGFGRSLGSQVSGETQTAGRSIGSKFGDALKVGAAAALGAAGLGAVFLKGAIDQASDLNEASTKIEAIFGRGTNAVNRFAAQGAQALGQTRLEVLNASATFGTFGKAAGLGGQDLAKFSTGFTSLATDLASFNNTSPEQAVEAIGAALRGEAEPIRQYGVLLDDATLKSEAMRLGLIKTTTQALTPQQKVLAAQAAIYKQTADAQGDFQRTSGGLANQQRILKAQFADLQGTIGRAFLPIAVKAVTFLNQGFAKVGPIIASLSPIFDRIKGALSGMFAGGGGGAASFAASLVPIFSNIRSTVTGLVAAFVPFVQAVLPSLIAGGQRIAAALVPALTTITGIIANQLVPAFKAILPVLAPIVSFLVGVFAGAVVGAINGVVQTIKGVVGIIAGVVNLVKALIHGDWSAAWAALKQIVVGAFNAVVGAVKTYLNIGILRLFGVGLAAIRGLWASLWGLLPRVAQAGAGVVRSVAAAFFNFLRSLFIRGVQQYIGLWRGLFNALLAAARAGMAAARGVISSAMAAIRSLIASALNAIRSAFSSAWNAIRSGVSSAFAAIRNAVSNGISAVLNLVRGLPGQAKSALGSLGDTLKNAGAELIQGLINGITSKIDDVKGAISSVAGKIKGFLPGSPVKEGPLKAWNNTGPTGPGGQLVGMLAKGMGNISPIQVAAKDLAGTIAENFRADTFADNFTLHGAVSSLRADAKRASEFSQAARRAKKLGLDGGLLKDVLASGNTALLQDITSTEDVRALERAWRARNKATDFFGKDDEHTRRLEDAVERGAEKGTRKGSGEHRTRENAHRRSKARRAAAP